MQEAFLAAVNKSRQRQPIKGCSVCGRTTGQLGTKLPSGGVGDEGGSGGQNQATAQLQGHGATSI